MLYHATVRTEKDRPKGGDALGRPKNLWRNTFKTKCILFLGAV